MLHNFNSLDNRSRRLRFLKEFPWIKDFLPKEFHDRFIPLVQRIDKEFLAKKPDMDVLWQLPLTLISEIYLVSESGKKMLQVGVKEHIPSRRWNDWFPKESVRYFEECVYQGVLRGQLFPPGFILEITYTEVGGKRDHATVTVHKPPLPYRDPHKIIDLACTVRNEIEDKFDQEFTPERLD